MSDDSDCTVGVQEDTDPSSPSILGEPAVETVEDGSVSDILPPSAPSNCNSQRIEGNTQLFVHDKAADHSVSLSDVINEQEKLYHQLTTDCFTTQDVMVLEKKAKQIEKYLKDIRLSNQDERKRIAESYSKLKMSEKDSSNIKERLRNQLLALASRQKHLLSCFTKQNELSKTITQKKEELISKVTSLQPQPNPMLPPPITISDDDMQSLSVRDDLSQVTQSTISTITDYCQPVSLDALVNHKNLKPGNNCLSCVLMGCSFKASLMDNGSIEGSTGKKFLLPQQWVNDCWLTLGHTKRITRKHAYKNILYECEPLMNFCESYNQKQVNSYKKHSSLQSTSSTDNDITITNTDQAADDFSFHLPTASTSITSKPFNITEILSQGIIVKHQPLSEDTSLDLPAEFWGSHCHDVPANIIRLIEEELMF